MGSSGNGWRTLVALGCIGVIGGAVALMVWAPWSARQEAVDEGDDAVAGWKMATEVGGRLAEGDQVIVLLPGTEAQVSSSIRAAYRAFRETLLQDRECEVIPVDIYDLIEAGDNSQSPSMLLYEQGVPADLFRRAHELHPSGRAYVSFVGTPSRFEPRALPPAEEAVLGAIDLALLSGGQWTEWLRADALDLLILPKADIDYQVQVEELDRESHFEERFVLLTPDNWQARSESLEGLF